LDDILFNPTSHLTQETKC